MSTHTITTEKSKKKAGPKKKKIDNLDSVQWQVDSITANEYLHAVSADSHLSFDIPAAADIPAALGKKTLASQLTFVTGITTRDVPYSLSIVDSTNGSSIPIDDGSGGGLFLVIDTIGGMMPEPPDGE